MTDPTRRQFCHLAPGAALALGLLAPAALPGQDKKKPPPKKGAARPPRLELDMVRDFVGVAHRDLDKVEAMYKKQPALLNATWDWGGGDFETALGAAAHTGRKNIANFLLGRGARLDIFAAAMLGKLEVVKAAVAAFPGIERSLGPHRIPLIAHAKAGKDDAAAVVKFLESLKS